MSELQKRFLIGYAEVLRRAGMTTSFASTNMLLARAIASGLEKSLKVATKPKPIKRR